VLHLVPKRFTRTWLVAAVALLLAGVALYWARSSSVSTTPGGTAVGRLPRGVEPHDLNLLLITLDTTRADRIGAYGGPAGATPVLDQIAREGVLFERAVTPAPLTLPAHSSLFTSRYPYAHGVRDNGGFFLEDDESTLAEELKAQGFKTGGFVGAYVLDRRWGIGQGFDTYFDEFDLAKVASSSLGEVERPADEVADRALAWLDSVKDSRFFAWVHFYDAHSPYAPPEPYRSRFADRPYVGEVAFVDAQVGRLRSFLEAQNLLDNTVVVILSDHGESLGDHGEETHGFFIYEPVIHVPLLIRAPYDALGGRRVGDLVRSIDVMPTVLDLLGVRPAGKLEGQSLVGLMSGAASELGLSAYAEAVYPRYHFGWSELRSVTSGGYKYIDAPRPELYDLKSDPHETRNLYQDRRAVSSRLEALLKASEISGDTLVKPSVEVDADTRARLAALGYVGSFAAKPAADRSRLADPKDKIDLFNLMIQARELIKDKTNPDEGLKALREVVTKDPEVIDAWVMIGNEHSRRGEFSSALDAFQRALALNPDYELAVTNMANTYRAMGRDEDALVGYRRVLELDPRSATAHQAIAQIFVDQNKLDEAQAELNRALALQPEMAAARNTLGALLLKRGKPEEGEREIRAALEKNAQLPLAHFNLALVAEGRGDWSAAVAEYQKEIELQPKSYMAQFNLGKVYERQGNRLEQLAAFRAAVASNPDFAEGHLFLAKLAFDLGQFAEVETLARRGISLNPKGEFAPLGHFVMADLFARQGRQSDAAREVAIGRQLAAQVQRTRR
jgi:arylsulfatase A-like enzyme/Tfp pilus assembly protein PilF